MELGIVSGFITDDLKSTLVGLRWTSFDAGGGPHVCLVPFQRITTTYTHAFSFTEAEGAALDFGLPEMVQATFFAMLLKNAMELGIVSGFITDDLKSTLVGLRWTYFEDWMSRTSYELREAKLRQQPIMTEARGSSDGQEESSGSTSPPAPPNFRLQEPRGEGGEEREKPGARERMKMNLFPNFASTDQVAKYIRDNFRWALREPSAPSPKPLPLDYRSLCPHFDLRVATRYAHNSHVPKMVQATFYAMVVDDAAELGLSHRLTMDYIM
ncbi:hypothetical protein Cgig2_033856 [Carnegiea gigantea]|uniref:Uncharacterized protein n=1 Tax=Carnegiea gigantea TaxID=171969 RepID=A0A9Q1JNB9_9CARY|nr:hypothetical protein Cgig2_033856 [Carnegiea gigantea]